MVCMSMGQYHIFDALRVDSELPDLIHNDGRSGTRATFNDHAVLAQGEIYREGYGAQLVEMFCNLNWFMTMCFHVVNSFLQQYILRVNTLSYLPQGYCTGPGLC